MYLSWEIQRKKKRSRAKALSAAWAILPKRRYNRVPLGKKT
jgi:hypothetical protein